MIRIIGVQRNDDPQSEFILLQNQGSMRVNLRGHAVVSDAAIESCNPLAGGHVFADDITVPPGMYVLLRTCAGEPKWGRTKDGALVYHTYMARCDRVWGEGGGPLHVLSIQHSYVERPVTIAIH
jgi:hypothetical protein